MSGLVLRGAEVEGRSVDVLVHDGRIVAVGADLSAAPNIEVVEAGGRALIPGLHDHHIHLHALAAHHESLVLGPPGVSGSVAFADAVRRFAVDLPPGEWIRAVDYHESVAGDLDRHVLDRLVSDRPMRVQHRSGALWILNSRALSEVGLGPSASDAPVGVERGEDGAATGRLWRLDGWLSQRVPRRPTDLGAVGGLLLRHGVTGATDATPTADPDAIADLAAATGDGRLPQRIAVTGAPGLVPDVGASLELGPVKVLRPDHLPPDLGELVADVRAARTQGRAVAIHCVTAAAAALAVVALDEVGPLAGDRIEHGAVLSVGLAARIAELGITVVTNPGFIASRGDEYLAEVDVQEIDDLWTCRRLLDAGASVGAGTDAPFGDPNPWRSMASAVGRSAASGAVLGAAERIERRAALELFLGPLDRPGGPPRRVEVGSPADLCLLPAPLEACLAELVSVEPILTVVRGQLHRW